ncbi:MAG: tol-pal system protein YbgF [Nitrospirota bacterium]
MSLKTLLFGRILKVLPLLTLPVALGGCFASQQDLDPIRSDISVLEKQFMEVQRDCAKAKYSGEGEKNPVSTEMGERISDVNAKLSAIDKRLDSIEAQVRDLKASQSAVTAPQPMAPEPVPTEPGASGVTGAPGAKTEEPTAPQPTKAMLAVEDMFNEAMKIYSSGDYEKAEAAFEKFLAAYPKDRLSDDARFMVGETYYARGQYQKAITEYQRVVDEYPLADRVPDALFKAGKAYSSLGDQAKAKEYYTRVMDNYPYSDAAKKAAKEIEAPKQ